MTAPAPDRSWPELLTCLLRGDDLTTDDTAWAMAEIMGGEASPVQMAGFLVALRAKGETVEELRGLADVMLAHAHRIEVPGRTVDIVGTGGDRHNSVNISTMAGIVLAGSGLTLVKHGNRASSSMAGSADVLEALGVSLTLTPSSVAEVAGRAGITFCFANAFHPAMRHAATARRELAVATAFNMLGPLTNPAQPRYAAVGVADSRVAPLIAGVFAARGTRAVVFRGRDGLDELTLSDASDVWWVDEDEVRTFTITPEDVGLGRAPLTDLRGGDAAHNAAIARQVLAGAPGAPRDAVLLNAGAAIARASGMPVTDEESFLTAVRAGVGAAAATLDDGDAAAALQRWVEASSSLA